MSIMQLASMLWVKCIRVDIWELSLRCVRCAVSCSRTLTQITLPNLSHSRTHLQLAPCTHTILFRAFKIKTRQSSKNIVQIKSTSNGSTPTCCLWFLHHFYPLSQQRPCVRFFHIIPNGGEVRIIPVLVTNFIRSGHTNQFRERHFIWFGEHFFQFRYINIWGASLLWSSSGFASCSSWEQFGDRAIS